MDAGLCEQRNSGARVETAAEKHSYRNIAAQIDAHGVEEQLSQLVRGLLGGSAVIWRIFQIPIRGRLYALWAYLKPLTGKDFTDPLKECFCARDVAKAEICVDIRRDCSNGHPLRGKKSFDL